MFITAHFIQGGPRDHWTSGSVEINSFDEINKALLVTLGVIHRDCANDKYVPEIIESLRAKSRAEFGWANIEVTSFHPGRASEHP